MKFTVLTMAILTSPAYALPVAKPDVVTMTANADVIVVGHEAGTTRQDLGTPAPATFNILPKRLLKGTLAPREAAVVDARIGEFSPTGLRDGNYGIFFLKSDKAGKFKLVDPNIISLNAYPGDYPLPPADTPILSRIAVELAHVFTLSPAIAGDPATGLSGTSWSPSKEFPGQDIYAATYDGFSGMDAESALQALDLVIPNAPFPGNVWAASVALSLGETTRLDFLLPLMMDPAHAGAVLDTFLITSLIRPNFGDIDVSRLGKLMTSKDADIRAAALQALEKMESPATVPVMESVIDGADRNLAKRAVGLICFLIHSCNPPAMREYYEQPANHQKLRALIRTWQKSRGK